MLTYRLGTQLTRVLITTSYVTLVTHTPKSYTKFNYTRSMYWLQLILITLACSEQHTQHMLSPTNIFIMILDPSLRQGAVCTKNYLLQESNKFVMVWVFISENRMFPRLITNNQNLYTLFVWKRNELEWLYHKTISTQSDYLIKWLFDITISTQSGYLIKWVYHKTISTQNSYLIKPLWLLLIDKMLSHVGWARG